MRGLLPKSLDATPAFEGDVLALTGQHLFLKIVSVMVAIVYMP